MQEGIATTIQGRKLFTEIRYLLCGTFPCTFSSFLLTLL